LASAKLNRSSVIEDCAFHAKVFCDPCGQIGKAVKGVSVSRDQFSLAGLDMSERTKAVDLKFVDELIGIKGLCAA
jgi:hypothetical protein